MGRDRGGYGSRGADPREAPEGRSRGRLRERLAREGPDARERRGFLLGARYAPGTSASYAGTASG